MKCLYCEREGSNKSIPQHQSLCKLNPNKRIKKKSIHEKGILSPNYGKKGKNQHTKALEKGLKYEVSTETRNKLSIASKNRIITEEFRNNMSIAMKKAVEKYPNSYTANNISGRTPIIEYKEFKLKGSWELEVAKMLDLFNIKWTNKIDGFNYVWNNSIHKYFPDFYLIDYNCYIEVKGYKRERDVEKWKVISNLIIIEKNDIFLIKEKQYNILEKINNSINSSQTK